jgi:hypothetical protein
MKRYFQQHNEFGKLIANTHGYLTKDAELSGLIRREGERWHDLWVLTDKGRAVLAKAEEAVNA